MEAVVELFNFSSRKLSSCSIPALIASISSDIAFEPIPSQLEEVKGADIVGHRGQAGDENGGPRCIFFVGNVRHLAVLSRQWDFLVVGIVLEAH